MAKFEQLWSTQGIPRPEGGGSPVDQRLKDGHSAEGDQRTYQQYT